ncbi:receptor-like protein EIX1 [Nicotiana sylvestris]|uniref:receptor-like protein EIX1 n=1 Tax=Nicotiana sylvestris TaxID=4096 RepID=UPI00388CB4FF
MDTKEHCKPIQLLLIYLSTSRGNHAKVLCITTEREALLEFKRGLIDEYDLLSSWRNEEDNEECCSWRGVKCSNTTGHILVLNLRGSIQLTPDGEGNYFMLRGIIRSSLVKLQYLKYLDLSSNEFGGEIPKYIGYLKRLEYLNFSSKASSNGFTGLIPPQLQNLTYLKVLDLGGNFFEVKNLEWLSLYLALGVLRSLEFLSFEQNALGGSLINLTRFSSLRELRLRDNLLNGIFHESFRAYLEIHLGIGFESTTLDLSENLLSGGIPNCWTRMSVPMILNVANNRISGSIPYSLCSSTALTSLYMRKNNLSGQFPASLKNCQGLSVLDLGRNILSGKIPEWIGTKLAYLGSLSLRFNEFSGSIPPSICQLQSIQILDLSGNHLSGKIPQCFSNFTSLQLSEDGSSVSYDFDVSYFLRVYVVQ